jgi:F-type H+-transporting ATPase subunit b
VELNWSTFVLEIINFLILVWILKRFLYKPVLNIIARRKAGIEQTLNEAKNLHSDAEALRDQYDNRLRDWEQEKQQARDTLQKEIDKERTRLMQELRDSLEQERERARVSEQHRLQTSIKIAEETALNHGAQFASLLLKSLAGPEIEVRLLELLINELGRLSPKELDKIRKSWGEMPKEISIVSAYPLLDTQRQQLQQALNGLTQQTLSFNYEQDSKLLAGLSITIGAWRLDANLRDELKSFAELAYDS